MAGAVNYIDDVTLTVQGAGADDGNQTRTPSGTTATVKTDRIRVRFTRRLEDHSNGQDEQEFMRRAKQGQAMDIDKKLLQNDALAGICAVNDIVVFSLTGSLLGEPFNITNGIAIIGDIEAELGAPSTSTFAFNSYGVPWA